MTRMVNIYNSSNKVIGTVKYNNNLDTWNGGNYQNRGVGRHLGITKVSNGRYCLIFGTDWEGENDYAHLIPDEQAFQLIMKYNQDLLDKDLFKELSRFKENLLTEL